MRPEGDYGGARLRSRVRSYFRARRWPKDDARSPVADLEFIVTDNEVEALILETTLVKQYKPRYNIKPGRQVVPASETNYRTLPRLLSLSDSEGWRTFWADSTSKFGAAHHRRDQPHIFRCVPASIDGKAPRPCLEYRKRALDHA